MNEAKNPIRGRGKKAEKMSRFEGGEVAVEVFLPDVHAKRLIRTGEQAGMTHRKFLPVHPRTKLPGHRFLESTFRLTTPDTRRPDIDYRLLPQAKMHLNLTRVLNVLRLQATRKERREQDRIGFGRT